MNDIVGLFRDVLSGDPHTSLVALLVAVIAGLVWYVMKLDKRLISKDEKIDKILEEYHAGLLSQATALKQIEIVLVEMKGMKQGEMASRNK